MQLWLLMQQVLLQLVKQALPAALCTFTLHAAAGAAAVSSPAPPCNALTPQIHRPLAAERLYPVSLLAPASTLIPLTHLCSVTLRCMTLFDHTAFNPTFSTCLMRPATVSWPAMWRSGRRSQPAQQAACSTWRCRHTCTQRWAVTAASRSQCYLQCCLQCCS